jgi:hypothetical protein
MIGEQDRWLHTANYMNMNEHRLGILDGRGYRVMLEMPKTSGRIRFYQIRNREWGTGTRMDGFTGCNSNIGDTSGAS